MEHAGWPNKQTLGVSIKVGISFDYLDKLGQLVYFLCGPAG